MWPLCSDEKFNVLYTEGNLNNHIGVPLTLLRLRPEHDFAVIETGANHPGEIAQLSKIVQPNCGLITNVGKAHLEGFGSFEGVVKTKTELYRYLAQRNTELTETLITGETRFKPDAVPYFVFVNGDNELLTPHVAECGLPSLSYGSPGHDYTIEGEVLECAPFLTLRWRKKDGAWHKVNTQLVGAYNIDNVLAAVLVGLCFKVPLSAIDHALQHYAPHNNRSEYRKTEHNSLIIDAYNANLSSMQAALGSFRQTTAEHKMMILGDMRELGEASAEAHAEVLRQALTCGCEEIWLVGRMLRSRRSERDTPAGCSCACVRRCRSRGARVAQSPHFRELDPDQGVERHTSLPFAGIPLRPTTAILPGNTPIWLDFVKSGCKNRV